MWRVECLRICVEDLMVKKINNIIIHLQRLFKCILRELTKCKDTVELIRGCERRRITRSRARGNGRGALGEEKNLILWSTCSSGAEVWSCRIRTPIGSGRFWVFRLVIFSLWDALDECIQVCCFQFGWLFCSLLLF